jgi:sugar phosphate isomerase/epimerase
MTPLSRRTFVKGALLCSATAVLAADNGPQRVFPTEPRARLAVATYPFREFITAPGNRERDSKKPGMDLATFAARIPKEFGVHGIEPLSAHFPSTEASEVRKLRAAFDAAGVHVVNIPVDVKANSCSDDPTERKAGDAAYRHWVDIAVMLGSPSIRIWIPKCSDFNDIPKAVKSLRPTIDYAATQNIVVNMENDDPVSASVKRTIAALKIGNSPWLRALPDFGNGLVAGDEKFNLDGVRQMFAYAFNISHVKDCEIVDGKRKSTSLAEIYGIAKAAGYRGYFSMESESGTDPFVDTKRLIEESVRLI